MLATAAMEVDVRPISALFEQSMPGRNFSQEQLLSSTNSSLIPSKSLVRTALPKILQLCWKDNLSVRTYSSLPWESQERGIRSCFTNFLYV